MIKGCTQVLLRLQAVLDSYGQAGEDEDLVFLTRLIQLACGARAQLKQGGSFPPASQGLIKRLYPALMAACLADATAYTGTRSQSRLTSAHKTHAGSFPPASQGLIKRLYPALSSLAGRGQAQVSCALAAS